MSVSSRENIVMEGLCEYYMESKNIKVIQEILHKESKLTLRVLEWYITVYCKEKESNSQHIYENFKIQLKAYSKKLFDPFCRGDRIILAIDETTQIETTVGQLNFFRFVIENNVIDTYTKQRELVEKSMITNGFKKKKGKNV